MKVFQAIQRSLALVGIEPEQVSKKYPINSGIVTTFIILVATTASANRFFWYEASNFKEYADSFYATSTVTVSTINFVLTVWNIKAYFQFIQNLESFIARSELFFYGMDVIHFGNYS